jgi:hypothetical protein
MRICLSHKVAKKPAKCEMVNFRLLSIANMILIDLSVPLPRKTLIESQGFFDPTRPIRTKDITVQSGKLAVPHPQHRLSSNA